MNECTHSPSVSLQGPAHSSSLQHSSPSPTRTRLHAGPSWLCPCPWPCPCPCPCPCSDMVVVTKFKVTSLSLKAEGKCVASVRQCMQRGCGWVDGVVGMSRENTDCCCFCMIVSRFLCICSTYIHPSIVLSSLFSLSLPLSLPLLLSLLSIQCAHFTRD